VAINKHRKISKIADKCHARGYWDFIGKEEDLIWKSNNKEPEEIDIAINPNCNRMD
jgi:hypothetical protein